ncbi:MAG: tetratricopeptide repeat protein [Bradymonadaceae bacterium]
MTSLENNDASRQPVEHARERLMQAYLLTSHGRLEEALRICEEVSSALPSHAMAPTLKGAILIAAGQPQEALKHLAKVCRRHPDEVLTRLYFCEACFLSGRVGRGLKELGRLDHDELADTPWEEFARSLKEVWEGVDPTTLPDVIVVPLEADVPGED